MYGLVILITIAIIFLVGWISNDLYREYKQIPIENKVNVIKIYEKLYGNGSKEIAEAYIRNQG